MKQIFPLRMAIWHAVVVTAFTVIGQAVLCALLLPGDVFRTYWWVGALIAGLLSPICAVSVVFYLRRLYRAHNHLAERMARDDLTGLTARRFLVEREMEYAKQHGVVIMLDVDHFKSVNDTFGHEIGDRTLRRVAATLRKSCRAGDVLCRYGGEEFVIFCPNTDSEFGAQIAQRLCDAVRRDCRLEINGVIRNITISGGWGVKPVGQRVEDYLRYADAALYSAKAQGRDMMVEVFSAAS